MNQLNIDGLIITEAEAESLCESTLARDAHLQVNKYLIQLCGLEAAVLLADLISKHRYFKKHHCLCQHNGLTGWFYNTISDVQKNTTLSAHKQRKAIQSLMKLRLIYCEEFGKSQEHFQNRRYFHINFFSVVKKLYNRKSLLLNFLTTGEHNTGEQGKAPCCEKIEQQEEFLCSCCEKIEQQKESENIADSKEFQESPVVKKFNTNNNKEEIRIKKRERKIFQTIPKVVKSLKIHDLRSNQEAERKKQQEYAQQQKRLAAEFLRQNDLNASEILEKG